MPSERGVMHTPLPNPPVLYLAFELSSRNWKLAFSTGFGQQPRIRTMPARDVGTLAAEIDAARARFDLPKDAPVVSCYEAGRDGFWLHRYLSARSDCVNLVVDSSAIEVKRQRRRVKTDRIDALKLVSMLIRYHNGDRQVWSVVHAPSPEAEDARNLHREMGTLKTERTRVTNRIKGLLTAQGLSLPVGRDFLADLDGARLWDGSPLHPFLRERLEREWLHRQLLNERIKILKRRQLTLLEAGEDPALALVRQLMTLRGIGLQSAWMFTFELFAWRQIKNRRQLAGICGFSPTPFSSGDLLREQGISKAGNSAVRAMAVQIAWSWLRFQPTSELSVWFAKRFAHNGRKARAIGIVAVARKLLIELWSFLETGALPEGAVTVA